MREIRFRAWDKAEEDFWEPKPLGMVFFDLHNIPDYIHQTFHEKAEDVFKPRFEIMQYTGLKDKNGTEVYEGDVIEHSLFGKCTILYDEVKFCFYALWHDGTSAVMNHCSRGEVIGNIYQKEFSHLKV